MSNSDKRLLQWAVDIAIESEYELIECHRTDWHKGKRIVPKENRPVVTKTKRIIARLKKLKEVIGYE